MSFTECDCDPFKDFNVGIADVGGKLKWVKRKANDSYKLKLIAGRTTHNTERPLAVVWYGRQSRKYYYDVRPFATEIIIEGEEKTLLKAILNAEKSLYDFYNSIINIDKHIEVLQSVIENVGMKIIC